VSYFTILSQPSLEGLAKALKTPESKYIPGLDSQRKLSQCKTGALPFEPPPSMQGHEYTWVNMLASRHGGYSLLITDGQSFESDTDQLLTATPSSIISMIKPLKSSGLYIVMYMSDNRRGLD
jgi:hypothetical protein